MAKSKKSTATAAASAAAVIGLAEIVAAGANGLYTTPEVHGPLVEAGMVELNPAGPNESGETLTRATQKGIESMNTATNTAPATVAAAAPSSFAIEDNVPMPTGSGRGRGGNVYPFDALEVGQSFFVPNSEDKPNAAKSLASTVSSATARFAVPSEDGATKTNKKGETVPVMVETRKFVVRSVEGGARVWRTA
ncbi:hypothetical protein Kaya_001 [Pseudomonas phage Kaya]|uniref:Uncharacterized protein n=1 Tax=Pseudomonas phage Kaya TaxID=2872675 RepID=A0AAE9BKX7_9CAUD|nr:hypothetical protein PM392_gp01 [Pseudomonas phage Kaya]UAG58539.1 hypothetical protein Kaya_001 [Pseudomonas phage Kaya]